MSELPEGWRVVHIGEVCEINPRDRGPIDPSLPVSFVPMPMVSDIEGIILEHNTRPFAEVAKGYTRFRNHDVIFAKITPCMENGKIAVADQLHNGIGCGSTEFHVLRCSGAILPEYLWRFLRQESFREEAERHMAGAVGQQRVPAQYLKDAVIPLPRTDEQRRIVAKLDSLFAHSKAARAELAHVPRLVERAKQAVLAQAFAEANQATNHYATIGDLAVQVRNGVARRPENHPPGIPILKISAIRPMMVRMEEMRYYILEQDEDVSSYTLKPGDLLFTRYNGNPDLVANCGMIHNVNGVLIYPDKLIRVRLNNEVVDSRFVEILVATKHIKDLLAPYIKSAAGQHGISGGDLKRLSLPVPPLSKQREIISYVEAAFARIDRLAEEASRATALLDRLEQATLAKAFRGELPAAQPVAPEVEA